MPGKAQHSMENAMAGYSVDDAEHDLRAALDKAPLAPSEETGR